MVKWMQLDRACFRTHGDTCGWLRALAKNPRSWAHLYIPICHYVLQYNECIIQYIHIQILISHGISTYIPSISHQYNQSKLGGTHTHTYIYIAYITQWFAGYFVYPLIGGILPWLPRFGTSCTTDPSFSRKAPANPDGDMPCATSKTSNWYHIY